MIPQDSWGKAREAFHPTCIIQGYTVWATALEEEQVIWLDKWQEKKTGNWAPFYST